MGKVENDNLIRVTSIEEIVALPANTTAVFVNRLDDEKLAALAPITSIRRLLQDGSSQTTDEGLKAIGSMVYLEELDLEWSQRITDDGLTSIYDLSRLKWLDLGFCPNLSMKGLIALKIKLPKCEIVSEKLA